MPHNSNTKYDIGFRAPAIPTVPQVYSQGAFEHFNSILRIYFNQLDNAFRHVARVTSVNSASGDYTVAGTSNYEIVVMTNSGAAVVYLPLAPDNLLEVAVKRTNAQVTVNGNGKNIDGAATKVLGTALESVCMTYINLTGEWVILCQ